ncbi:MAG: hypothetical protein WBD99_02720 [Thermodesulfobacteriota bacterium]
MPEELEPKTDQLMDAKKGIAQLKQIVKKHKVYWIVQELININEAGDKIKNGFVLHLVGTRDEVSDESKTSEIFKNLDRIAQWIMPKENPEVRFEIRQHDSVFFYLPGDDRDENRKNLVVSLRLLHHKGFHRPIDKYQIEAIKEMEKRLKNIGSPKDHWKTSFQESI